MSLGFTLSEFNIIGDKTDRIHTLAFEAMTSRDIVAGGITVDLPHLWSSIDVKKTEGFRLQTTHWDVPNVAEDMKSDYPFPKGLGLCCDLMTFLPPLRPEQLPSD
ncbi:MAG: hypothetical protein ACO4AJ_02150 [Prochlorothrix sp.]